MAYRNKLYIAFDGDNDMHWYRMLTAWKANEQIISAFCTMPAWCGANEPGVAWSTSRPSWP